MKDPSNEKLQANYQYLRIADEIENKVGLGSYRAGDKLPSLRSMHTQTGLSISTIYQAYIELENRGVVEARRKSGYYVKPLLKDILPLPEFTRHISRPKKVSVNNLITSLLASSDDPDILPIGTAVPSPELLPVKQLKNAAKSVLGRYFKDNKISYGPPDGISELKRQIAQRSIGYDKHINEEGIVMTNGCMDAIHMSLNAVAKPGDTIVVESPTFICYLQLIEDLNMLALELPSDPESGVDFRSLEKAVKDHNVKACLFNPNYNNPLGYEMPESNKKRLVEFLGARKIPIIEDDIYGDLYFGRSRPKTMKSYDQKGMVLYCSSFSKSLAPDLRVGWVVPGKFIDQVKRFKFNSTIAPSRLNQMIVYEFLKSGAYDRHLRRFRNALRNQAGNTALSIARSFPKGTKLSAPKGGFVIWVQLNEAIDAMKIFNKSRTHNIFFLPGRLCTTTRKYNNCMRISYGYPWNEKMEQGIITLARIISDESAGQI